MRTQFDCGQLQDALKQDRELVYEMMMLFTQLQPPMMLRLETAIANRDCVEIYEAMHILKSRLRNFYCPGLGDDAESIERLAKNNQFDAIKEAYTQLRVNIADAVVAIRTFLDEAGE
jgi:HPt (histidine-containing phosphotransfer) domain-containing protein